MPFDDIFPNRTIPRAYANRNLSNSQLKTLSKKKLYSLDSMGDKLHLPLVKSYEDELNWVYKRSLAIGYSKNVSFDCVKGFYYRFLTKFITPYLTYQITRRSIRDNNRIRTEEASVNFYRGLLNTAHGNLYQHPMPDLPDAEEAKQKYIMGARLLMLRESFMAFMKKTKARLQSNSANLSSAGLVPGGARINNLTKIIFTGSDPHHGMQVVLILHFGKRKIVYKPRDTRVDELLVGRRHNVGTHPCAGSLGELLNANGLGAGNKIPNGIRGYAVPVYKYLSCGEYGFVQCLELDFDNSTRKHYERFAWLCGVYAGMGMIFGITDLHQGNMMLCKRKLIRAQDNRSGTRHCIPHLTDLEIAFSADVVGQSKWKDAFDSTGLENGIRKTTEIEYMNKFKFEKAGTGMLIKGEGFQSHATPTDNLPRVGRAPMQLVTKPTFGQSFKNGAIKVFKILRDMDDRTKETFINRFIGCKVRYHAIATTNQLDKIRAVCQMGGGNENGVESQKGTNGF